MVMTHIRADVPRDAEFPCLTDPDLFFAESPADIARAKQLCADCPAAAGCLAGALERAEPWGVWGGELVLRGAVIASKRGRGRPPGSGARSRGSDGRSRGSDGRSRGSDGRSRRLAAAPRAQVSRTRTPAVAPRDSATRVPVAASRVPVTAPRVPVSRHRAAS
jgi:WhiB family redox-sensing transcriptional regulator